MVDLEPANSKEKEASGGEKSKPGFLAAAFLFFIMYDFQFSDRLCLGYSPRAFLGGLCFLDNLLGHLSRGILIPGKLKVKVPLPLSALTDKGSEIAHFRQWGRRLPRPASVFRPVHAQNAAAALIDFSHHIAHVGVRYAGLQIADRLQQRGRRLGIPVL